MRSILRIFFLWQVLLILPLAAGLSHDYPPTPIEPVTDRLHGIDVVDPFRWLENGSDPKVIEWTAQQNRLTRAYLDAAQNRCSVNERMASLCQRETCLFVDVPLSPRRFIWRKQAGQEHSVLLWDEEVEIPLIDPNRWPEGTELQYATPSLDGTYVAYGVANQGDESPVIRILHVESGEHLSDTAKGRSQGWLCDRVWWLPDNSGFYYTAIDTLEHQSYPTSVVYFHRLGTSGVEDTLVFGQGAYSDCILDIQLSDSGRWILFSHACSCGISKLYLQSVEQPESEKILLAVGGSDLSLAATFAGDDIVLVTDQKAPRFKAYLIDPTKPQQSCWQELIPECGQTLLNVKAVAGRYYAEYLSNASTVIKIFGSCGECLRTIDLPAMGTASVDGLWNKPDIWIDFTSFAQPKTRYRYDMEADTLLPLVDDREIVDPSRYHVEQVWYPSKDGTLISMFLIRDLTCASKGTRPVLLSGYGGFGVPITPCFKSSYLPFVEAGGLVAIPNLRGGGEYGRTWHQQGIKEKKQNVFDDFIASAEWLIAAGITTPQRLAISGRSNGGLLVGAAMTQRPDLFRAVLCEVPLLDMVRYHQFGFSNIWSGEYGSADNKDQFPYLINYSPYHCVKDGVSYPAVLVRGASRDARTDALHARKMVARLQVAEPHGLPKFLLVDEGAGHLGGPTLSQTIAQNVESLVFIMDQLGMVYPIQRSDDE